MAETTLTPPATILPRLDELPSAELQERLQVAMDLQKTVGGNIDTLRKQLEVTLAREALSKLTPQQRIVKAIGYDTLLNDPSRENDMGFEPSPLDTARRLVFEERQSRLNTAQFAASQLRTEISGANSIQAQAPQDIADLERQIGDINSSYFYRFTNMFTGTRKNLQDRLSARQAELRGAPQKIADAQAQLPTVEQELRGIRTDENYDFEGLHVEPVAPQLLDRSQQSVLFRYDKRDSMVTIRMPKSPEDTDFTRVMRLEFVDDTLLNEFADLVGKNLYANGGVFSSVGENIEYEFDIAETLVPFALEVVEINGEKQFRLPQVVFDHFKLGKN